jgi:hypothetical protein
MTPNISKELKKATEVLQTKMLAMQEEEAKMLALKTAFVNATNPAKKEKAKPALIAQAKKLKQAEAEADAADKAFHKILSTEPEEIYDLLDHKVQEHVVRMAIRKIVKESINLQESEEVSLKDEVESFFNSNKKKLKSLADDDDWDEYYELGFEKFPEVDQDDVAQAMNNAALAAGWFENKIEDFRQSEKELEDMAFGSKAQQKGVNMGDYDKKMKQPKASPTELYIESKKKDEVIEEAEYRGRKVKLGKPFYTPGGPRKRAVYVRNDKGNVVKVGFGEPGMKIKKNNPARRKSFRARHKCDTNPGPRWKARYWSCKAW